MKAATRKVSVRQARSISTNDNKRNMREHLRSLPHNLQWALVELQEECDRPEGLYPATYEPRWVGIRLAVKDFAGYGAIVLGTEVETLEYGRKLCTELASHPALSTRQDHKLIPIDLGIAQMYNALQRYLVQLEKLVGKDADIKKGAE